MTKETAPDRHPAPQTNVVDFVNAQKKRSDNPRERVLARAGLELARKRLRPTLDNDEIVPVPIKDESISRLALMKKITDLEEELEMAWADYFERFCATCGGRLQECECPAAELSQIRSLSDS